MTNPSFDYSELPCGVFATDKHCKIIYCNKKFLDYIKSPEEVIIGKALDSLMTPASKIMFQQIVLPSILHEEAIEEIQLNLIDNDNNKIPVVFFASQKDENEFVWCSFVAEERNKLLSELNSSKKELEEANAQLKTLSKTDFMTNCFNRREGLFRLTILRRQIIRRKSSIGILLLDLDHFKLINDHYGHNEGDEVLKKFSKLLIENARIDDVVVRYGGEEFLVILSDSDASGVMKTAERIRLSTENLSTKSGKITVSIGACHVPYDARVTNEELIEIIDKALYQSKETGRNKITLASLSLDEKNQRQYKI